MAKKTAAGLVAYAKAQLGKPYWYGTIGQAASRWLYDYNKGRFPEYYWWSYGGETKVKVHDCVGLIKGYLWSDSPDDNTPDYNESQDLSAEGMYAACKEKGSIGTMPEEIGVLVFQKDHVGVYIGNGEVVEARGHNYGVVKTKINERGWDRWGKCPFVVYEAPEPSKPEQTKEQDYTLGFSYLRKGNEGDDVKALQQLLIANGISCGKKGADGDFGNNTKTAVITYQERNGLTPDGVVGAYTMGSLLGLIDKGEKI